MTIRSRLLLLLLPTLSAFILLISFFFYINWSREILDSFQLRLQSIVEATAKVVGPKEVEWLQEHLSDSDLTQNPIYREYKLELFKLKQKLPIQNLYIVHIEPNEVINKATGKNSEKDDFRQVFILDVSGNTLEEGSQPGETDFSETGEHQIYFSKKTFVTPIYEAKKTHERFMSAYAPILNQKGDVTALLGADVSIQEIDEKLQNALFMIFLGSMITVIMIIMAVFLIADKISKPVRQLNHAALDIAAGEYENNIQVQGPKEIVELANTLNTMSECLADQMQRLKENSLIRERLYGEHECALLLQHYMLEKVVDDFRSNDLQIFTVTTNLSKSSKGLSLKCEGSTLSDFRLTLIEAKKTGFAALYELTQYSLAPPQNLTDFAFIECFFENNFIFRYIAQQSPRPLVWSLVDEQFVETVRDKPLQNHKHIVFLYNNALFENLGEEQAVKSWLTRILRHFAKEELNHLKTILNNELNFLARGEGVKDNLMILALYIL